MALKNGYIKVWRRLTDWEWYDDINTTRLFLHLLLTVNYEPQKWRGRVIQRGQRAVSLQGLATETGLTVKQVRVALNHLNKTNEVASEGASQYTVITVENYERYQGLESDEGKPRGMQQGKQGASKGRTEGEQGATMEERIKKVKESKKVKEEKNIYGEFHNVKFTAAEFKNLQEKFPLDYQDRIERLSVYIESTGKSYKSHYATLLNWARRDQGEARTHKKSNNPFLDMLEEMGDMDE